MRLIIPTTMCLQEAFSSTKAGAFWSKEVRVSLRCRHGARCPGTQFESPWCFAGKLDFGTMTNAATFPSSVNFVSVRRGAGSSFKS